MTDLVPAPDTSEKAPVVFTAAGLRAGVRRCLPVALGVFTYGLVFGVLARQAGLSVAESLLMSGIVYAGASQFAALGLWATPLPVIAIVLTTLVINLRHVMMSASLYPWLGRLRAPALYGLLFFLTDESWAVSVAEFRAGRRDVGFFAGAGLLVFVAWLAATAAGYLIGEVVTDPASLGLDFALTAVFTALLVGLWRGRRDLLPWGVAAVVAIVGSRLLPGNWYILLGGLAGSVVGALRAGEAGDAG